MRKHSLYPFFIVLLFLPSLACRTITSNAVNGSGDLRTQTIDISSFDRVSLDGMGDVFIEQGEAESLSIQTDENIFPFLDTEVRGGELILSTRPNVSLNPSQGIVYNLTVKDLNKISLRGSGNFNVEPLSSDSMEVALFGSGNIDIGGLDSDLLSIILSGSGNITIEDLSVKTIDTSVNGSGDIKLDGSAQSQSVSVNGSGNYLAGDLETVSADITVPGSADITVWVQDQLTITLNGSGTVRYYGKPTVNQSGSGSGDISSLGEK